MDDPVKEDDEELFLPIHVCTKCGNFCYGSEAAGAAWLKLPCEPNHTYFFRHRG